MVRLKPEHAIPAHFVPLLYGDPIEFTRRYLVSLEKALDNSTSAAEVILRMKLIYPNLPGEPDLEMTAKVLKGEMAWKTVGAFPAIARKAEVNFGGEFVFELDFHNEHSMTFRSLRQRAEGRPVTGTVEYTAVDVAPQAYMVYWTEKDNTHVVHVEDFGHGVAYTNISAPDGAFTNLKGAIKLL